MKNTRTQQNRGAGSPNHAQAFADNIDKSSKITIKHKVKTVLVGTKAVHFYEHEEHGLHSGVHYKNKQYVTHSKLDHEESAVYTFMQKQKVGILLLLGLIVYALIWDPIKAVGGIIAVLTVIYFIDSVFTLYLVKKNLNFPAELQFSDEELASINEADLPIYTILAPLYKEFEVLPDFIENVKKLNYPHGKLDVMLLLEENDTETIALAEKLNLPFYIRTIIVPHSYPKTKPKACNYGLWHSKGEYVVIYDAEDQMDPMQLKKAYLAFKNSPENVVCVQAKLNYFNSNQNLLTRFFTAEYSLWFDVILPGFQSINTVIPLGGTSNHFKVDVLKKLHGWDAFNVTEDADLGARLFKKGYKTTIIDSVTWEEANSNVKNWIRQRSRWIKGYLQTYLVHMRRPLQFLRHKGIHWFIFQLIIGMRISFIVINPILWATTISYFVFNRQVGEVIESLYPAPVFYMAVFSLIFGNFVYLYNYMIGLAKRGKWNLIKFVYLVPLYWLLMAVAAWMAIYQLFVKPHHWEKTNHGLVKDKKKGWRYARVLRRVDWAYALICTGLVLLAVQLSLTFVYSDWALSAIEAIFYIEVVLAFLVVGLLSINFFKKYFVPYVQSHTLPKKIADRIGNEATFLVFAGLISNFINYLYNSFLSRNVNIESFGVLSIAGNFLFLMSIPLAALSRTVTYKSAFILGKDESVAFNFWRRVRKVTIIASVTIALIWIVVTPYMKIYFNIDDSFVFFIYIFVIIAAASGSVDGGFLNGVMKFRIFGFSLLVEALSKLALTVYLFKIGRNDLIVAAVPLSVVLSTLYIHLGAIALKSEKNKSNDEEFPSNFFKHSILIKFAVVSFLTFDVFLAKHYLTPSAAGYYALLALAGKMIYFVGSMFSQFIVPYISKESGESIDTTKTFYKIVGAITATSFGSYLLLGVFGFVTAPILFGDKSTEIVSLLPYYGLGILCFTIASGIISYYQIRNFKQFTYAALFFAFIQITFITNFHSNIRNIVDSVMWSGILCLVTVTSLHLKIALFQKKAVDDRTKVLILNWYDIKHKWAGGAELYIHEIAKRMVENGTSVTMFVGKDKKNSSYEVVDGIEIYRKGGLYTVIIWAFIFYIIKFRGKFDVVIDIPKGVPFFSPIYVRKPKFGLVHHIHQEMFRTGLKFPTKQVSMSLEKRLMPIVYRKTQMLTISQSSKHEMEKIGLGKKHKIEIIPNGVEIKVPNVEKSSYPTILYLGRLRFYKRVDVLIKAFKLVAEKSPTAQLIIAGRGEEEPKLKALVKELDLAEKVIFKGHVTDEKRAELYTSSWVAVQPSIVEGWGLTNLEANFCGTSVVAANSAGLRESVLDGKTGLLVEQNNVQAFANAINLIIEDEKFRKSLEQHALIWAKKFSWENSAETLGMIIDKKIKKQKETLRGKLAYE